MSNLCKTYGVILICGLCPLCSCLSRWEWSFWTWDSFPVFLSEKVDQKKILSTSIERQTKPICFCLIFELREGILVYKSKSGASPSGAVSVWIYKTLRTRELFLSKAEDFTLKMDLSPMIPPGCLEKKFENFWKLMN